MEEVGGGHVVMEVEMSGGASNKELSVSVSCSSDCSFATSCVMECRMEKECVENCMEKHNCTEVERTPTRLSYQC